MLFAFGGAALPLIFMLARPLPSPSAEPDIRRDATVAAVERVMPSVVNIGTKTKRERRGLMWDWYRENWSQFTQQLPAQESAGSGVIIDEEGYVLTAAHVVDGADEIWVKLYDNRIVQAKLVTGTRKSDVAL
ncbi:MAG: trypsin-like peptidase domain-containing protein, partial [Verrucomicrobia bacterium]|nr:trypsin-like peptidase domain-containing protein [Verrucomicrobiota bacterium]